MIAIQTLSLNYKLTENPFLSPSETHYIDELHTNECLKTFMSVMIFHLKLKKTWRLKSESYNRKNPKNISNTKKWAKWEVLTII